MSTERDLLLEQLELEEELLRRIKGRDIDRYYTDEENRKQYQAHLDIFRAGRDFRERAAFGGNRVGKSHLGGYETALHLTGEYPDWWNGHRFDKPITAWACGTTLDAVRDISQEKLLGPPTALGCGMIPSASIIDKRRKSGVPDLFDSITVKHVSGGVSTLQFKPYAAGREAFQGRKIQFVWLDEEPDWPVYEEVLLRTTKTSATEDAGKILFTMTPLKGLSDVATHFLEDGKLLESNDRYAHLIGWQDVPHIGKEEQEQLLASIPKHQREARTEGYPSLGVGAIYSYSEDSLVMPAMTIPMFYQRAYGLDVGWNATAAAFIAIDPDSGCIYVTDEYKMGEASPHEHATTLRLKADNGVGIASGAVDPASRGRSQKDGSRLIDEYRDHGLHLVPATNQVEAGLFRIQGLMDSDQLKIFDRCTGLLSEMRMYQRDDRGKPIKRNDHILDALRYAVMTEEIHYRPRPANYKPRVITSFGLN